MTPVLMTACLLIALAIIADKRRAARRVRDLRTAARLLEQHREALDAFLADNEAPVALRHLLIDVSETLDREEDVMLLIEALADTAGTEKRGGELWQALDELARSRPDLYLSFLKACMTGLVAAVLRFDSTAVWFHREAATLAADGYGDALRVASKVSWLQSRTDGAAWAGPARAAA